MKDSRISKHSEPHGEPQESCENLYLGINKNQSNISDILDILDKDFIFNDRTTCSVYMSKSILEDFILFAKSNGRHSVCELLEKLMIYGMQVIPNKKILFDQTYVIKKPNDVQSEMKEKVLCYKLGNSIDRVLDLKEKDMLKSYPQAFTIFMDNLEEATKISNPSDKLLGLMEKARLLI